MIRLTDTSHAPLRIVPSDDKKAARVNRITPLLQLIPQREGQLRKLGKRQKRPDSAQPGAERLLRDGER